MPYFEAAYLLNFINFIYNTKIINVPANTPAKDFWSVIVYSTESKGFIIDAPVVGWSAHAQDTLQFSEDGSADIYFAPEAPKEMESN